MFLGKYDANGMLQWNCTWGGSGLDRGNGVTVNSSGDVYVVGNTGSFGSGGWDMFLTKYDANGMQKWNCTWGGSDDDSGSGIAIDLSGNIYITGSTSSYGAGENDMVLVKYGKETASTTIQSYNFFIIIGILSISSLFMMINILQKRSN